MSWVMLEKNGTIYKYVLYDNTHLFNRGIMDVQIEGWNPYVPMNYDDIICIRTSSIVLNSIPDLPLSLKELEIRYSQLTTVPVFPAGIQKVIILHSGIVLTDKQLDEIRSLYPKKFIQIENPIVLGGGNHRFIDTEEQLRNTREEIRNFREGLRDVREGLQNAREELRNILNDTQTYTQRQQRNVLDSGQTVHISSLNNDICKAILIIKEKSQKCPTVKNPIDALFDDEKKGIINKVLNCFAYLFKERGKLYRSIQEWCDDKQVHSLHKLTFLELFQMIMNITEVHPQKTELKERIRIELTEAISFCFTGRINRLVNALVGFIDDIIIGLSVREMTQLRIQSLIRRLMDNKINVKQTREEMTNMFSEIGEDYGITDIFKQANLLALNDFEE